jgi:hypothetical protein
MIKAIFAIIFVLAINATAFGQAITTPGPGSPERKAILDTVRIPVEKVMEQKIVFVVQNLKVQGTWAFVDGYFQRPDGSEPILDGTIFDGDEDIFENNFFGLLRKTGGKWRLTTHAISCTDICYSDWWRRYKAPKAIFPYTE